MLLTAEEWLAHAQKNRQGSSSAQKSGGKQKPHGGGGDKDKGAANAAPRRAGNCRNCRYCEKAGHWAKECHKAAHDCERRREVANVAVAEEEEGPGLLMAKVCLLTQISGDTCAQEVNLNEERVIPVPSPSGVWYLDSGVSSHMTGVRDMFSTMDESMHGTVRNH
jgi:hypothetical protein